MKIFNMLLLLPRLSGHEVRTWVLPMDLEVGDVMHAMAGEEATSLSRETDDEWRSCLFLSISASTSMSKSFLSRHDARYS